LLLRGARGGGGGGPPPPPPARGFGRTGGHIEIYRGKEYEFDFIDKIRIEVACTDEQVEAVLDAIVAAARTGVVGDGKVWVLDVERVVRVRTNERGPEAL
jgi:nitrogen regulatory protein PII